MSLRLRLALIVAITLLLGAIATRIELSADLADALPAEGAAGSAFRDIQRFSLLDTLIVEIDGTGKDEAELHAAVDTLGARLAARPDFASVRYRYGLEDGVALRKAAGPSLALLGDDATVLPRLTEPGMVAALTRARDRMLSPAGAMIARSLDADPLDLGGSFTESVLGVGSMGNVTLRAGHLFAEDGQHALILARANTPAMGTTRDSPLVQHLEEDLAASPLPATWIGSHRFAAEAAEQITREVNVAVTADMILLVLVFLVSFRSFRPVFGAIPALVVGGAAAAAAGALRSPIHGISLAFGGALAGMGVDYWIHLYLTAVRDGVPDTAKERLRVALDALDHLLPAYLMSVAATLTAFLLLATSSYQAVADLAWIGIGTATGALTSVILGGPAMFALIARPGDRLPRIPLPLRIPGWFAGILLLVLAGLGTSGIMVRFDGDPRAMDARIPGTAALERAFEARYGGAGTTGLVVAEAATLDEALDTLDRACAPLRGAPGISLRSALPFLPSPAAREKRLAALADPALEAHFTTAADTVGFASEALLPGLKRTLAATVAPTPATWAGTAGQEIIDRTVRVDEHGAAVAAIVAATTREALEGAQREVELSGVDARFVYPAGVAKDGADRIRDELLTRSGLGLLAVLLFMALRYRDLPNFLAAALPSLGAAAGTLGVLSLTDLPLTPVSGPAMVLVLGVAFDQGVFLVEARNMSDSAFLSSRAAILVALATAFAGFVGLTAATHPAVFGMGAVVSLGIFFTFVTAFLVVPAVLTETGRAATRKWTRRVVFALVLFLAFDGILAIAGRVPPPPVPTGVREYTLEELSPTTRRYGPNQMTRDHGVWVLRVEGSPYEIGRATSRMSHALGEANETALIESFFEHVPNPVVEYLLGRGVPLLASRMSRAIPAAYLEELRGLTDEGEDPYAWIAPRYTRKLCYHAIHDVGQAMVDSPLLGCTGFIAGGARTPDGHWRLGRNWDFDGGPMFDRDKSITYVAKDGAIPFAHVAIVGLVGSVSGLNAEGIGVAVLAAASDAPIRPEAPMIFIVREILESARSIEDARRILDQRRGFVSEAILVVDGKRGEGAVLEVTPDQVVVIPAGDAIAQANHFRSPDLADDAMNLQRMEGGTTVARLARMEELIAPENGPIDLARALAILRDRGGPGGAPLPAGHEGTVNADVTSHGVLIDATEGSITVSMAPNLAGGFVRWTLADLAAGDLTGEQVAGPDDAARTYRVHEARRLRREAAKSRPSKAEGMLRTALQLDPGSPEVLIALGETLIALDRGDEARTLLEAAIATPPARKRDLDHARALLEEAR